MEKYRLPKEVREKEEARLEENPAADVSLGPGHAYNDKELENDFNISKGIDLWSQQHGTNDDESDTKTSSRKKHSKDKKHSKKSKHKANKSEKKRKHGNKSDDDNDMELLDYERNQSLRQDNNAAETSVLTTIPHNTLGSKVPVAEQGMTICIRFDIFFYQM